MPWWVWLILVLFMVAMLVAGVAYAVLHAIRAAHSVGVVGAKLGERLSALSDVDEASVAPDTRPLFTLPLDVATGRYADAHAGVISRREAKRDRHAATWADWDNSVIWRERNDTTPHDTPHETRP